MKHIAPRSLDQDELAALDLMQSVASEGLPEDDRTTLRGVGDVIAGRTFDEEQANAHTAMLIDRINSRVDG